MDHISLCAVILYFGPKSLSPMEIHENMAAMLEEGGTVLHPPKMKK